MEVLIFALVVGVGLLIVLAVRKHQEKVDAAWRTAANELGLAYQPARLFAQRSMRGEVQGCHVVVDVYRRQSGKHSESYTRYKVHYPTPLGLGLRLEREHALSGVAKFFGSQDIEVGDGKFDDAVMVKGSNAHRIQEFLTPSRRMRVLRLFDSYNGSKIADDALSWRRRGTETDAGAITTTVRRLVRTARGLHGDVATDDKLDAALLARREGRLEEALAAAREAATTGEHARPEARMLEGDVLYTAGRREEAAAAFADAQSADPGDPELAQWAEHARSGSGEIVEPAEIIAIDDTTEATAAVAPKPTTSLSETAPSPSAAEAAIQVCKDLFEAEGLSLQISKRFEQRYEGKRVRWTGVLRQARRYAFDLVFGQDPGTKLVIDLHEVKSGAFGRMVQAVVQLPEEALEALESKVGQEVTFEGRLTGCDAFMRNLFVAAGRVVE